MSDEIYLDKIALGGVLVQKALILIAQFNQLITEINRGIIDLERLNEYPLYNWACSNLSELYDALKFSYLKKLRDTKKRDFLMTWILILV